MEFFVNCNTSSLALHTDSLESRQVSHLYRRIGFSANQATIDAGTGSSADALVNQIIADAEAATPIAPPLWADWTVDDYPEDEDLQRAVFRAQLEEFATSYGNAMLSNGLLDRLSFFWSNHFVTERDVYNCNSYLYYYINCLQRNALGNFKTFVSEVGLTSAMLYYLDGAFNNGNNPNENYARELYELFTLGEGNGYTEDDVIETARALSGYTDRGEVGCSPVNYRADRHDAGEKTILGRTGNWGYDDVIDILFEERPNEIATFICTKLYEFFVHPDSSDDDGNAETIISGMAATFIANDFELAPVMSQLLKSQHFFDDDAIGVIIKSPFDMYFNFMKETNFPYDDSTVLNVIDACRLIGQTMFDPVDVAGWQRDRQWINTNYIIGRWLTMEVFLERYYQLNPELFRDLAMEAVGPADSNTSNPETVVQALVDKFLPKGLLTEQDFQNAVDAFKIDDVPENYYSPDYIDGGLSLWMLAVSMESPLMVYTLMRHLSREPEFQLK